MAGEYEVDFRVHPEAYRYQSGEQGVFRDAWQALTDDPAYQRLKERHQDEVYDPEVSPMVD